MRRLLLAILGVLSITPLVFGITFSTYLLPELERTTDFHQYVSLFNRVYYAGLGIVALSLCLGIGFVVFAAKAKSVPDNRRVLWLAMIVMAGIVVLPLFWYRFLWRASAQPQTR